MEETQVKEITNIVVETLKEHNLISRNKDSFGNTKKLLFNIDKLKQSIVEKKQGIKDLEKYGLPKTSGVKMAIKEYKDEDYRIAEKINNLKQLIYITECTLKSVNRIISKLEPEELKIIEMRFFDKLQNKEIAEKLYMSEETISRKTTKIINEKLKIKLFPVEFIEELGY